MLDVQPMKAFADLTKFGIVIFVLLSGIAGYMTSFAVEAAFLLSEFLFFLFGLYFISSGSLALNQVQEYKTDRMMARTAKRPIATGSISPRVGLILSLAFIVVGFVLLNYVSALSAWLGLLSVVLYNGFYTLWWKRKWIYAAIPGAIPGALPVTIGFAVHSTEIFSAPSVFLFLIMFLWQMPHFWALAIKYKDDYRSGEIPTLPVALGLKKTLYQTGLYTFAYCGVALATPMFFHSSWFYILLTVPFAIKVMYEMIVFLKSNANKHWLGFFLWTNFSMLIFLFVPVVDKWSFLFLNRV